MVITDRYRADDLVILRATGAPCLYATRPSVNFYLHEAKKFLMVVYIGDAFHRRMREGKPRKSRGHRRAGGPHFLTGKLSSYSGFPISLPSSPTTPRRKVSTQITKITPCTTVTQDPIWAR